MTPEPRHPRHPPLTFVPILALLVAAVAAVVGLTPGDGRTTETVLLWALGLTVVAAVPAAVTGTLDWRALAPGTRAANTAGLHAAVMVASVIALGVVLVRALVENDRAVDGFEGIATLLVAVVALGGASIGAFAAHALGAGHREETLTQDARRPARDRGLTTGAGR
jgi:uncharacterized membrane protein